MHCEFKKMKPVILYGLIGWCFWLGIFSTSTHGNNQPHRWEKLYLVHHWPVTVCKMNDNNCEDPVMYWTIHGLWPDKTDDCNKTWHFNISKIQDLIEDLEQYWPDVLHPNHTYLWKHEWEKHGTCAAALESLNSQKKYFSKALEIYKKINLNSYLLKVGIKPGSTYYQMEDIRKALLSVYSVIPKIQCLSPEEGQLQILGQIKFCLTKEFTLRNCTESKDNYEEEFFDMGDLANCNDTLTYYPLHVHSYT